MTAPEDRISQGELQRRYHVVRTKMKERGLELLLVSGVRFVASTGYLRYLTNWAEPFAGEFLVFPLKGEPLFLARTAERSLVIQRYLGMRAAPGSTAAHAAAAVRKTGCKRVGICSLSTMFAETYVQLTGALQNVTLVEAGDLIDEARMIKSEEELGWVKKSAALTDIAFKVFKDLVRPGRTESEAFIEVDHVVKRNGAENTYFMMSADPRPLAKFLDLATDTYEKGDIVLFNAEVSGPGGYYTQLERTLCLGQPTKEAEVAYEVCLQAENAACSLLRAGVKAKEVYWAIASAIEESGHKMGLHPGHSQGLDIFERPILDTKEEAELAPGMIIVVHPHVLLPSGGGVWIGDTFLVTDQGPLPLQKSGKGLGVID